MLLTSRVPFSVPRLPTIVAFMKKHRDETATFKLHVKRYLQAFLPTTGIAFCETNR